MLIESRRSEAPGGATVENARVPLEAGDEAAGEFRCAECGYGVIVRSVLPACPMCQGIAWDAAADGITGR